MRHRPAFPTALTLALAVAMVCSAVPAAGTTGPADDVRHRPWSGTAAEPPTDATEAPDDAAAASGAPLAQVPEEATAAAAVQEPVPGRVLVGFQPGTTAERRSAVLAEVGGTLGDPVPGTDVHVVTIGEGDPTEVSARLLEMDGVALAQPDHVRSALIWPDDPLVWHTWESLRLMGLPRAWDDTTGTGTVVAVLDTGVYAQHEDLIGAVLPGTDLINGDRDAADDAWQTFHPAYLGHGTLVAGVIAATGDNNRGAVGAAPTADVLPVKVLDADGNGSDSVIAEGIAYAVAHGADVVNLSLGGPAESPVLLQAVRRAVAAGVVVVAAAGNHPRGARVGPQYPAAYAPDVQGLLSVGATQPDGRVAPYSVPPRLRVVVRAR